MPVSQGSPGGYMPGMTLRAWAVVDAAGALVKGSGVAAVVKTGAGTYKLTLSGAAVNANAVIKGTPRNAYAAAITAGPIAGNDISYVVRTVDGGTASDSMAHVEVWD